MERTLARSLSHLDGEARGAVEKMAGALVAKLLHPTMDALRNPIGRDPLGLVAIARLLHGVESVSAEETDDDGSGAEESP